MDSFSSLLPVMAILCVSGIAAGFVAGLLGLGGGIIFVPVYYFIFCDYFAMSQNEAIVLATSTSLMTMIPTTMSSCIAHIRHDNYLWDLLKVAALALCRCGGRKDLLSFFRRGLALPAV